MKEQQGQVKEQLIEIQKEIQKDYQNKPKFNGVYSKNNLPKIKDGALYIFYRCYI